jgi:hypothetical protein
MADNIFDRIVADIDEVLAEEAGTFSPRGNRPPPRRPEYGQ